MSAVNPALLARLPEIQTKVAELAGLENVEAILDRLAVDLADVDPFEAELSLPLRIEVLCRRYLRLQQLHDDYDKLIWACVWRNLKTGEGMLQHYRDSRFIAQDLNQACWARIAEQIGTFKDGPGSSITGWLWKVSQNTVTDWKRKSARRESILPSGSYADVVKVEAEYSRQASGKLAPRKGLITDRLARRNKRAVLCPECDGVIPVIKGTFQLACGHARPKGLP